MSNSRSKGNHGTAFAAIIIITILATGIVVYSATQAHLFGLSGATVTVVSTTAASTSGVVTPSSQSTCSQNSISTVQNSYQQVYTGATGAPTINRFVQAANGLANVIDNPGAHNWGAATTSSQQYTLNYVDQFTATNSYPLWVNVGTQGPNNPITAFGQTVYNVACVLPQSGTNNALVWNEAAQLFAAPTNGLTATVNSVQAVVQYPSSAAPSAVPTTQQSWNFILQILQPNVVGMIPTTVYGTIANPVQNYANEAQVTTSSSVSLSGVFIIAVNETNVQVTAPGAISISPLGGTAARAWVVPISSGCAPSPASTSITTVYNCVTIPVSIYESTVLSHHASIIGFFEDMQQVAYVTSNLVTPAVTGWAYGTPAGISGFCGATSTTCATFAQSALQYGTKATFTFGTPLVGQNTGNPAPLISDYVAITLPN